MAPRRPLLGVRDHGRQALCARGGRRGDGGAVGEDVVAGDGVAVRAVVEEGLGVRAADLAQVTDDADLGARRVRARRDRDGEERAPARARPKPEWPRRHRSGRSRPPPSTRVRAEAVERVDCEAVPLDRGIEAISVVRVTGLNRRLAAEGVVRRARRARSPIPCQGRRRGAPNASTTTPALRSSTASSPLNHARRRSSGRHGRGSSALRAD